MDAYRTASRPKLETCRAGLETSNRDAVNTTTIGPCSGARSIYTNLQPAKLSFTIESSFSINVSSDSKKNRIKHWSFGIVENAVKVLKKPLAGIILEIFLTELRELIKRLSVTDSSAFSQMSLRKE